MHDGAGKRALLLMAALAVMVFLSGCAEQKPDAERQAVDACKSLCASQLSGGANLSDGPCLSNGVASGWVCDVAHDPRQPVDDEPANQCSAYGVSASHFVEVDADCDLIRAV